MTDFDEDLDPAALAAPGIPTEAKPPSVEALAIRASQTAFWPVVDGLIEIYRTFHKTRRPEIKKKMKEVYERVKELGTTIGVARVSLDSLWSG
jgi:hypothetical protein